MMRCGARSNVLYLELEEGKRIWDEGRTSGRMKVTTVLVLLEKVASGTMVKRPALSSSIAGLNSGWVWPPAARWERIQPVSASFGQSMAIAESSIDVPKATAIHPSLPIGAEALNVKVA